MKQTTKTYSYLHSECKYYDSLLIFTKLDLDLVQNWKCRAPIEKQTHSVLLIQLADHYITWDTLT